jgi:F0F1-type ATP synthase epsilon subunit
VTRLDRLKHGSGIKDRDDRSSGIEILIAEGLAKINPTDPLILAKQAVRRNRNCSDSSGNSLTRVETSRWAYRNSRRLKSS